MRFFSRKNRTLGVLVFALLLLAACSRNTISATRYTPEQIGKAIISGQESITPLVPLLPDEGYYTDYISDIYRMNADKIVDGAIFYSNGMTANEIAVFLVSDESSTSEVRETLTAYKERRAIAFMGYAPEQAAILENGIVASRGSYVALLICEDPQSARSAFYECFGENPPRISDSIELIYLENGNDTAEVPSTEPEEPPVMIDGTDTDGNNGGENENPDEPPYGSNETGSEDGTSETPDDTTDSNNSGNDSEPIDSNDGSDRGEDSTNDGPSEETGSEEPGEQEDVYNPSAILRAWFSGDSSGLSYKNLSIFELCAEAINRLTNASMSDYDKELIMHDWLLDRTTYDQEANSNSPNARPDPDNHNPYGALINGKAICSGYTSSFQLLMDMMGIECISVHGIYSATGGAHAWNMVRIDGEWYCVDTTWNDPLGSDNSPETRHMYFNVTTQFMLNTRHEWDVSTTPVADAGKLYHGK